LNHYSRMFFLSIIIILTFFMIINPQETVNAARNGFELWYSVLVPALLPFFIAAELLVSMGFAHFLGIILEPIMRPLFKLPGCTSLVVAMGFTSGFPIGAILTRRLYDDNMLTSSEAERVVSFTNNSSPLFILGAVGVGMFNSPVLGCLLAVSHYLANILVGLIWGFTAPQSVPIKKTAPKALLREALHSLRENKISDSPGKLLSNSIQNSINNILAIAGFIIIFSVLTRMLSVWGIMKFISIFISNIFFFLDLPYQVTYGMGLGLFEITIGSKTIASAVNGEILSKLLAVSIVLAFSGLSIIAQIMGVLAGTPIRLSFYLLSRLIQVGLSLLITLAGYNLYICSNQSIHTISIPIEKALYSFNAWHMSLCCMLIGLIIIGIMMIISLIHNTR